jgi:hypothetical protein
LPPPATCAGFGNGFGTNAYFRWPNGLAVTASGVLYVVDGGNHRLRMVV